VDRVSELTDSDKNLENADFMPGCPFCEDNSDVTIAETSRFLSIYNQSPVVPGHCLIMPRRHVEVLMALEPDEVASLFIFARQVASGLLQIYGTTSFDLILQEGEPAGQTVPHLHLHVMPRKQGDLDSPGTWFESLTGTRVSVDSEDRAVLTKAEMRDTAAFLRKRLELRGAAS
jgi:bis(5'-adenosyl)-triphosphatase